MAKSEKVEVSAGKTAATMAGQSQSPSKYPMGHIDQVFEDFFRRWPMQGSWPSQYMGGMFKEDFTRAPSLDVIDRDNEVVVRAEVPGIDKKDIDISLTDNLLTIKGESRKESKQEKGDYHRREISRSSFSRSVLLPGTVDASKATASLQDGVLEVTLPKVEASKRRNIAVQ